MLNFTIHINLARVQVRSPMQQTWNAPTGGMSLRYYQDPAQKGLPAVRWLQVLLKREEMPTQIQLARLLRNATGGPRSAILEAASLVGTMPGWFSGSELIRLNRGDGPYVPDAGDAKMETEVLVGKTVIEAWSYSDRMLEIMALPPEEYFQWWINQSGLGQLKPNDLRPMTDLVETLKQFPHLIN